MRGILLFAVLGLASCNQPFGTHAAQPTQAGSQTSQVGRWTIIHSPHVQRDTMLLDTVTGQTWLLVTLGEDQNSGFGWEPVAKLPSPSAPASPARRDTGKQGTSAGWQPGLPPDEDASPTNNSD